MKLAPGSRDRAGEAGDSDPLRSWQRRQSDFQPALQALFAAAELVPRNPSQWGTHGRVGLLGPEAASLVGLALRLARVDKYADFAYLPRLAFCPCYRWLYFPECSEVPNLGDAKADGGPTGDHGHYGHCRCGRLLRSDVGGRNGSSLDDIAAALGSGSDWAPDSLGRDPAPKRRYHPSLSKDHFRVAG